MAGTAPTRTQLAAQIVHNIWRREPISVQVGVGTGYDWLDASNNTPGNGVFQLTFGPAFPRTDNGEYLCTNIYVAKCGDGVTDINGQSTINGIPLKPGFTSETCDEGAQNGQAGHCNTTCNGMVPPNNPPTCDNVTVNPSSGLPGMT